MIGVRWVVVSGGRGGGCVLRGGRSGQARHPAAPLTLPHSPPWRGQGDLELVSADQSKPKAWKLAPTKLRNVFRIKKFAPPPMAPGACRAASAREPSRACSLPRVSGPCKQSALCSHALSPSHPPPPPPPYPPHDACPDMAPPAAAPTKTAMSPIEAMYR